tara:strand:+ start:491 stop:616 length:126 start_codon:yes stop_codon:yes gene_type:complete
LAGTRGKFFVEPEKFLREKFKVEVDHLALVVSPTLPLSPHI